MANPENVFVPTAKDMTDTSIISTEEVRSGVVERIREELGKVSRNLDAYIPAAWILEDSKITVEIDLSSMAKVRTELNMPT